MANITGISSPETSRLNDFKPRSAFIAGIAGATFALPSKKQEAAGSSGRDSPWIEEDPTHVPRDVIEEAYNEVRLGQPRVFPAGNLRKEVDGEHFEEEKPVGNSVDVNETTDNFSFDSVPTLRTLPVGPRDCNPCVS
ncbi:hypothetical protein WN51_07578 [Melipona quadrifasciata]|uniref:Uncharacterized protein n=1 Tax=Melipona quadrifasciata TaxID=166423 RepID=A0A0M9A7D3_9HYME|nr:hypothetical protein WN51_07578 [Melipona quadrifasciata]